MTHIRFQQDPKRTFFPLSGRFTPCSEQIGTGYNYHPAIYFVNGCDKVKVVFTNITSDSETKAVEVATAILELAMK